MDNLIAGVLSAVLFVAFVAGLAESIGALPFILIVGIVSVMMVTDLVQSIRKDASSRQRRGDD